MVFGFFDFGLVFLRLGSRIGLAPRRNSLAPAVPRGDLARDGVADTQDALPKLRWRAVATTALPVNRIAAKRNDVSVGAHLCVVEAQLLGRHIDCALGGGLPVQTVAGWRVSAPAEELVPRGVDGTALFTAHFVRAEVARPDEEQHGLVVGAARLLGHFGRSPQSRELRLGVGPRGRKDGGRLDLREVLCLRGRKGRKDVLGGHL